MDKTEKLFYTLLAAKNYMVSLKDTHEFFLKSLSEDGDVIREELGGVCGIDSEKVESLVYDNAVYFTCEFIAKRDCRDLDSVLNYTKRLGLRPINVFKGVSLKDIRDIMDSRKNND